MDSTSEGHWSAAGKSYDEIWQWFSEKHGDNAETRDLHIKWRRIAADVAKGR